MRLKKIAFDHFRQFYGHQELLLATDDKKNVTLIHAENGIGKTTILNAVLWAFYGKDGLTEKFEQKDKILNFEAESEGSHQAKVSVEFEFQGQDYSATRVWSKESLKGELIVLKIDKGQSRALPNPESFIQSVVPRSMARYFFFDGEHAETFAGDKNSKEVSKAVRSMLGLDLGRNALEDLKGVIKFYNDAMSKIPGQHELLERTTKLQRAQEDEEANRLKIEELLEKRDLEIELRDKANEALAQYRESELIQKQRSDVGRQLQGVRTKIQSVKSAIMGWVSTRSVDVLARQLSAVSSELLDVASSKGKIPSPYNETFVRDLIEKNLCVCGRPLQLGTPEFKSVYALLESAGNEQVLNRVVRIRSRIQQFQDRRPEAIEALEGNERELSELLLEERRLEDEYEKLGTQIENLPIDEIAEKERERKVRSSNIDKLGEQLGAAKEKAKVYKKWIEDFQRQIQDLSRKHEGARKLGDRIRLTDLAFKTLVSQIEMYEEEARKQIREEVNRIIDEVARRHYRFEMEDDFSIRLCFPNGKAVPKSAGENQLMGLAFIASLVHFAKRRLEDTHQLLAPGTAAPLVLDSPFGQLDDSYRSGVVNFVPNMSSQVVLLVSSSQGNEEISTILSPSVGIQYVLISENRGDQGAKRSEHRLINGREYQTVRYGCARNQTLIQKVG